MRVFVVVLHKSLEEPGYVGVFSTFQKAKDYIREFQPGTTEGTFGVFHQDIDALEIEEEG